MFGHIRLLINVVTDDKSQYYEGEHSSLPPVGSRCIDLEQNSPLKKAERSRRRDRVCKI